jgi:hypothetical protein
MNYLRHHYQNVSTVDYNQLYYFDFVININYRLCLPPIITFVSPPLPWCTSECPLLSLRYHYNPLLSLHYHYNPLLSLCSHNRDLNHNQ